MNKWMTTQEHALISKGMSILIAAIKDLTEQNITFKYKLKSKNQKYDVLLQLISRSPECINYLMVYNQFPPCNLDVRKEKGKTVVEVLDFIYEEDDLV